MRKPAFGSFVPTTTYVKSYMGNKYLDSLSIDAMSLMDFGYWCWNLHDNTFEVSPKLAEVLRLPSPSCFFTDFLKSIYLADRDQVYGILHEASIVQNAIKLEFRYIVDDRVCYFLLKGDCVKESGGGLFYAGVGRDITSEKEVSSLAVTNANNLKRTQRIATIGSWVWEYSSREVVCDSSMYEIFGVDSQNASLNVKTLRTYFSPVGWSKCLTQIRRHLFQKKEGWFEQQIFCGNGQRKEISVFFEYEFWETGKIKAIHGVVQDVSRQQLVQNQLRLRIDFERMMGLVSSNFINLRSSRIDEGIRTALELISQYMGANNSYLFLLNEGKDLATLAYHWNDGRESAFNDENKIYQVHKYPLLMGSILTNEALLIEDVSNISKEFEIEKKILQQYEVKSLVSVSLVLEGDVIGFLGFESARDLRLHTDEEIRLIRICGEVFVNALSRKKSDQEIRQREEYLSVVLDSIGDSVIVLDENNKIINGNLSAEILTGYSRLELKNKDIASMLLYTDTSGALHTYKDLICAETEGYASNSWVIITKTGERLPLSVRSAPLKGYVLKMKGTVIVCREMSHQLKLEEQLRHSEKMRVLGQLSGGIAHDFNNLLTGIIGCAGYLKKNLKDQPKLAEHVENILITGRRAAALTSQLLTFSRNEKLRLVEVDLHQVVGDVMNLLTHSLDPKIQIIKKLNSPYSVVQGDESQLHNVLLNLAVNSRDAMPSGGILEFSTHLKELSANDCVGDFSTLKPGLYLEVVVGDTGCGIAPEVRHLVFEPFFTTKERGQGIGLGLAAVYSTIAMHQGHVVIKSELGKFTEFYIYLPLLAKSMAFKPKASEACSLKNYHKKILVVDDESLLCQLMCETLASVGFQVAFANSGSDALKIFDLDKDSIDLVLVDMLMPEMNGAELLERIYRIKPEIKAIVVSGFTGNLDLKQFIEDRNLVFLQKPYEENQLIHLVEQTLGMQS